MPQGSLRGGCPRIGPQWSARLRTAEETTPVGTRTYGRSPATSPDLSNLRVAHDSPGVARIGKPRAARQDLLPRTPFVRFLRDRAFPIKH